MNRKNALEIAQGLNTQSVHSLCVTCNNYRGRFECPTCKVSYCWGCWQKHCDAKICAYGKAKVIPVL